jgi:hypothetical protein
MTYNEAVALQEALLKELRKEAVRKDRYEPVLSTPRKIPFKPKKYLSGGDLVLRRIALSAKRDARHQNETRAMDLPLPERYTNEINHALGYSTLPSERQEILVEATRVYNEKFNSVIQEEAQMKTAAEVTKSTVKSWMKKNVADHVDPKTDEVNATGLAEAAAQEFDKKDLGGWLDDESHWVWEIASDVAEAHEKSSKKAGRLRSGLIHLAHANPDLRPHLLPLLVRKESNFVQPILEGMTLTILGKPHKVMGVTRGTEWDLYSFDDGFSFRNIKSNREDPGSKVGGDLYKNGKPVGKHLSPIEVKRILQEAEPLGKTAAKEMDDAEFQKLIKKIAKLTDENAHMEALQILAESFFSKKLVGAMDAIKTLHDFFGDIPSGLRKVINELTDGMWSDLKLRLPPEQYAALHGVF